MGLVQRKPVLADVYPGQLHCRLHAICTLSARTDMLCARRLQFAEKLMSRNLASLALLCLNGRAALTQVPL